MKAREGWKRETLFGWIHELMIHQNVHASERFTWSRQMFASHVSDSGLGRAGMHEGWSSTSTFEFILRFRKFMSHGFPATADPYQVST